MQRLQQMPSKKGGPQSLKHSELRMSALLKQEEKNVRQKEILHVRENISEDAAWKLKEEGEKRKKSAGRKRWRRLQEKPLNANASSMRLQSDKGKERQKSKRDLESSKKYLRRHLPKHQKEGLASLYHHISEEQVLSLHHQEVQVGGPLAAKTSRVTRGEEAPNHLQEEALIDGNSILPFNVPICCLVPSAQMEHARVAPIEMMISI
jgi:hypothetical protein